MYLPTWVECSGAERAELKAAQGRFWWMVHHWSDHWSLVIVHWSLLPWHWLDEVITEPKVVCQNNCNTSQMIWCSVLPPGARWVLYHENEGQAVGSHAPPMRNQVPGPVGGWSVPLERSRLFYWMNIQLTEVQIHDSEIYRNIECVCVCKTEQ